jgi:parallel beta-helix repeat protein
MHLIPSILFLAACSPGTPPAESAGRVLYVAPGEGGEWDDPAGMAAVSAFTSIQDAISAASDGDTVVVASGTFYEDLEMQSGVAVEGAGQDETFLVGTVLFDGTSADTSLSGMSLFDPDWVAYGTYHTNIGVIILDGNGSLTDVGLYYYEQGVQAYGTDGAYIADSVMAGNWYGAVMENARNYTFVNNLVVNNGAGGIASTSNSEGAIIHNTFVGNAFGGTSLYLTGAVAVADGGTETVLNNIMVSNYYGLNCASCSSDTDYNLIWGNTTNYINDASSSSGDLSADPLFNNAAEGDYTLSAGSPAIDAGTSRNTIVVDAQGEVRPQGDEVDMGFDEFATSALTLVLSEVMANAATESTDEFVEIYNAGSSPAELSGLILTDGDDVDTLVAFGSSATVLAPGGYAVVLDPEYAGSYTIDSGVVLMTTEDTTIGNGLTTSDKVTLYEDDGSTIVATFSYPKDPGDGVSMELVDLETGDANGNWRASQCADGSSPGAAHCFPESGDPADLVLTEIMANADSESTGEYVEIYNPTDTEIDAGGLYISDGDSSDALVGFQSGSTLIPAYGYGIILDPGYAYDYYLPIDATLLTTEDATIGDGIANSSDPVTLYDTDGTTVIDTYGTPVDPGNGVSMEKVDYAAGDVSGNWVPADDSCSRGASPGRLNGASGGSCGILVINEVMANADDEDTGEFVEIYNAGFDTVDLAGLIFTDGDAIDTLTAYDGSSTELAPGEYAVVLDAEYAGEYSLEGSAALLTTTDTTLGNGLSVSDEIELYETDGINRIAAYRFPENPGNGVSLERVAVWGLLDSEDNWAVSTCASGGSPGGENCVSAASSGTSISDYDILLTEVMSNPLDESTGEFVELYNNSSDTVDLLYMVIYDGDAVDTVFGWSDPYDTLLDPGQYAVILDADYAGEYDIPKGALILTTDDSTVGSGLATSDEFYLLESDASTVIDTYTVPFNPGNGVSAEKVDITGGDTSDNWVASECSSGSSPGADSCF